MASYSVILKASVEKDLRSLSKSVVGRVMKQIDALATNPLPRQALKMEGGQHYYRIRIGDYRIVYRIDSRAHQVVIHYIRHRREVYRKLL